MWRHLLFIEPTELPPPRACDHQIPLIEGVVPFHKKPYRYSPTQKDEIEKQIKDMLEVLFKSAAVHMHPR